MRRQGKSFAVWLCVLMLCWGMEGSVCAGELTINGPATLLPFAQVAVERIMTSHPANARLPVGGGPDPGRRLQRRDGGHGHRQPVRHRVRQRHDLGARRRGGHSLRLKRQGEALSAFSRTLHVHGRRACRGRQKSFIGYMLSQDGQRVVESEGGIPASR